MGNYKVILITSLIIFLFVIAILFLFVVKEEKEPYCGDHVCEEGENYENCPEDCKSTQIEKGIKGHVTLYQGNCMPPAGLECLINKLSTTVKIYELIGKDDIKEGYYLGTSVWYEDSEEISGESCDCEITCELIGTRSEGWYLSCPEKDKKLIRYTFCEKLENPFECKIIKQEPIVTVISNQEGYYEIGLPNGQYSVLVEDPINENKEYCNSFDNEYACPVLVNDELVEFNIRIDHATW